MISAKELVAVVLERLETRPTVPGRTGDADLAGRLGLAGGSTSQRVKRWRIGLNEPDYEGTVMLLDAAGFLTPEGRAFLGLAPRESRVEDALDAASEIEARHRSRRARPVPREEAS